LHRSSPRLSLENFRATTPEENRAQLCVNAQDPFPCVQRTGDGENGALELNFEFFFGNNSFKKMLAVRLRRHKVTLNEPDAKAIPQQKEKQSEDNS
jgi:hypothetical protein